MMSKWIEWGGGQCPAPTAFSVAIKLRDGQESGGRDPLQLRWEHSERDTDIVAYMVETRDCSEMECHPLHAQYMRAIEQAMFGKGERHGGAKIDFLEQPWMHYAKMHGRGFLTGQAAKKLEEAASTRNGEAFMQEVRGAIVYLGMALIWEEMNGGQQ